MRRIFLVGLLAVAACNGLERSVLPRLVPGELRYTAVSTTGQPLLDGRMTITISDDSSLSGYWDIAWAAGADTTAEVGPQVGSGRLVGWRLADGRYKISLNPDYADYNVYLDARQAEHGWRGDWVVSGLIGPMAQGRFAAVSRGDSVPLSTDAVVHYLDIEVGCWILQTADARYQPLNLPDAFRVDGLAVKVELSEAQGVVTACMAGIPAHIESISRKE